jgi:hypothetical protein
VVDDPRNRLRTGNKPARVRMTKAAPARKVLCGPSASQKAPATTLAQSCARPDTRLSIPKAVPRSSGGAVSAIRAASALREAHVQPPQENAGRQSADAGTRGQHAIGEQQEEETEDQHCDALHAVGHDADGIGGHRNATARPVCLERCSASTTLPLPAKAECRLGIARWTIIHLTQNPKLA